MTAPKDPTSSGKAGAKLLDRYRVVKGEGFRLGAEPPDPVPGFAKSDAAALLASGVQRLAVLQERLYARATWSVLVVIQAMDAAGKDSTIKHVMSGVNPQGVAVTSFKAPGPEELAHDFLWRASRALPARGMIGIFNRSYYEEVLVARVHPEILAKQHLPPELLGGAGFWDDRLADIAAFETYLARQGTRVIKIFLDVSRAEQKKRFLERLDVPDKLWKFDPGDIRDRGFWTQYRAAYEAAIVATATPQAPWFVVPSDKKWFMRVVVVEAINEMLAALDLDPPHPSAETRAALAEARRGLEAEH